MLAIALFAALVAVASSQQANTPVPILKSEFDQKEDGSYSFS